MLGGYTDLLFLTEGYAQEQYYLLLALQTMTHAMSIARTVELRYTAHCCKVAITRYSRRNSSQ